MILQRTAYRAQPESGTWKCSYGEACGKIGKADLDG